MIKSFTRDKDWSLFLIFVRDYQYIIYGLFELYISFLTQIWHSIVVLVVSVNHWNLKKLQFFSSLRSFKAVRSCSLWLQKKCYRAQPYTALKRFPKGTTLAQPLASPIHPLQTSNIFGNFGNHSEKGVFVIFILSLYIIIYQYIIKREKGIIEGGKVVSKNGFQKFSLIWLWKLWKPNFITFSS